MAQGIRLIAGLGNPGPGYEHTRHNAGADWVRALARAQRGQWRREARFFGELARIDVAGSPIWLLVPETYMNRSGQAVAPLLRFHRLAPAELLVVHDELDLAPGVIRLKRGGGHGGHNGLRDIMQVLGGAQDFARLRIGIGHPGVGADVVNYVLRRAPSEERARTEAAGARALDALPALVAGDWDRALRALHTAP
ncbi:MAG TPA: aminoacyl-tRNA hydrolase [Porticoccaceae bacterium]|nr:aminoacyl-tRNA hydrolase [Porticoccaceae bacterium]